MTECLSLQEKVVKGKSAFNRIRNVCPLIFSVAFCKLFGYNFQKIESFVAPDYLSQGMLK